MSANSNSAVKQALAAIQHMRSELESYEYRMREPIAIIGMGLRYPGGANDPESYWDLLSEGRNAIRDVPTQRWDADEFFDQDQDRAGKIHTRVGGFLEEPVDQFDAQFFGISPREADTMDPQQRVLLEVAWEALEHAGIRTEELVNSKTGVVVGIGIDDYKLRAMNPQRYTNIDTYTGTGNLFCVAGGRISYVLGLQGPNYSIDVGCASSLTAVHVACQSLRLGECNLALAGGAHLMLAPSMHMFLTRAHALSPDGRCATFDASANGYVRGEGAGMIALKRLSDAERDGDRVLAVIRGSSVNHDGPASGLTVPNGVSQQRLIREALEFADLDSQDVSYVECHGTGTPLGDPIEANALGAVYGKQRQKPFVLGSVKTNMGHLEAAAGIAGLMKAVLAMRNQKIPANLHFQKPNPHIELDNIKATVLTQLTPWEPQSQDGIRRAAISSFGISGTNSHVIVEEAPPVVQKAIPAPGAEYCYLLPISARSKESLQRLAKKYATLVRESSDPAVLRDICYSASLHRSYHDIRLAVAGFSGQELAEKLEAYAADEERFGMAVHKIVPGASGKRKLVFFCSGQGPKFWPLPQELWDKEPVFRETLEQCDVALQKIAGWSILKELREGSANMDRTEYTQPGLCAVQIALAAVWRSRGIVPDAVVGHSMGEVSAACVAGALSIEDTMRVIYHRGRLIQGLTGGKGKMAFVDLSLEKTEQYLRGYETKLSVAANNSPGNTVISGDVAALKEVTAKFEKDNVFFKVLESVDFASHSPQMEVIQDEFRDSLQGLQPKEGDAPFYSTVYGKYTDGSKLGADYWATNIRQPVLFSTTINQLLDENFDVFVEIAPHPALSQSVEQCMQAREASGSVLASLRRDVPDGQRIPFLVSTFGGLWAAGYDVDFHKMYPNGANYTDILPTYQWNRKSYWIDESESQTAHFLAPDEHPFLGFRRSSPVRKTVEFESPFTPDKPAYRDHIIGGALVVPGACNISFMLSGIREGFGRDTVTLNNISFLQANVIGFDETRMTHLIYEPGAEGSHAGNVNIYSISQEDGPEGDWTHHAMATYRLEDTDERKHISDFGLDLDAIKERCSERLTGREFQDWFFAARYELGPSFEWIDDVWRRDGEALCKLKVQNPESIPDLEVYQIHPGLMDSLFQHGCNGIPGGVPWIKEEGVLYVPFSAGNLRFYEVPPSEGIWCYYKLKTGSRENKELFGGDLVMFNDEGRVLLEAQDFNLKRTPVEGLLRSEQRLGDIVYEFDWETVTLAEDPKKAAAVKGTWLVLGNGDEFDAVLRGEMEKRGADVVTVTAGDGYAKNGDGYTVNPANPEDFAKLVAEAFPDGPPVGVLHAWSLPHTYEAPTVAEIEAARPATTVSVVYVMQAFLQAGFSLQPRLWVATRNAQATGKSDEKIHPEQAAVWGLVSVAINEHEEFHCSAVDLGNADAQEARILAGELLSGSSENRVALRGRERLCARLIRVSKHKVQQESARGPYELKKNGTYLITGGMGGLGLTFARWIAESGGGHIVLTGRSDPKPEVREQISEIESFGAKVTIAKGDIAQADDVDRMFGELKSLPELKGIIHSAGILDDSTLLQMTAKHFESVMAPKVRGAWMLYEKTKDVNLDFFVLFSSASAILGTVGQGNYAASNAFMDALANRMRSEGRPGLSVNWGTWAEVGLAAAEGVRGDRLEARGLTPLSLKAGVKSLDFLLKADRARAVVMPLNLKKWFQNYKSAAETPLYDELSKQENITAEAVAGEGEGVNLREELMAVEDGKERVTLILSYLQNITAQVLRLSPEDVDVNQPLGSFGLDSLMALELRNRLQAATGLTLPATLAWAYPTIALMGPHLASEMGIPLDGAGEVTAPTTEEPVAARRASGSSEKVLDQNELDSLSDEDAEALLEKELEMFEN